MRARDFNELKEIVRELGEAQKRTEIRIDRLTEKVEEPAEVQKKTDAKFAELVEAQRKTEESIRTLAGKKLGQLKRKVAAVSREYPGTKIIKILVTHEDGI